MNNLTYNTSTLWLRPSDSINDTHIEDEGLQEFQTHKNSTTFSKYPPQLTDFAAACFILFAIIGFVGNFVSILALSKSKKLRNATTAFVVNLCVADLLLCGFSMPMSALIFLERGWTHGELLCKLFPLVRYSNGAVSLLSVIAITINRYILIVHPSVYRSMYRPFKIAIMIVLMWVSALVLLLLPFFEVWGRLGYDPKVGTCTILKLNNQSPKMVFYIIAFAVPSLVFVLCYSRIFCVVRSASQMIRKDSLNTYWRSRSITDHSPPKTSRSELKVLRVMLVIFVTFVLCYLPVSVVKVLKKEVDMPILNIVGYLGAYFSNIIHPVIYVVMSEEYRKAYVELFFPTPAETLTTLTTLSSAISFYESKQIRNVDVDMGRQSDTFLVK